MSLVGYISGRFNKHAMMPPSLRAMRIIAMCGIAVATATLIVTLAILTGFEREYKRTILDFNAHVVLLEAGEIEDPAATMELLEGCRYTDEDVLFMKRHRLSLAAWRVLFGAYHAASNWHAQIMERAPIGSFVGRFLKRVEPRGIARIIPKSMRRWHASAKALMHKGVVGVTPFIYREGLMIAGGAIKGVVIKGVDPASMAGVNPMRIDLDGGETLGSALNPDASGRGNLPAVLGIALARTLGLEKGAAGGVVKLLVPTSVLKGGGHNFEALDVRGTFESGLYDYDAQFALMSIPHVRALFGIAPGKVTGVELRLDDPEKAMALTQWLEHRLSPTWRAVPWNELNADIFRAVQMEKRTFSLIMGILMIVAAFNIVGVLVLLILMRQHEISLLRSLGMTRRQLQRVFVGGGTFIGLIGVTAGVAVGVGIALALRTFDIVHIAPEIYFLSRLPIDISPFVCGMIAFFCLLICWGTSKMAARRLSDIPISEGLEGSYR